MKNHDSLKHSTVVLHSILAKKMFKGGCIFDTKGGHK